MDGFLLLKNTNAYKIFIGDKKRGTLSHAYLVVCEDKLFLENYLKIFAKALVCNEEDPCSSCRPCSLIEKKSFTDVIFYPKGKKIVVSDVDDLIEKSYYKPLEGDKKVFVLSDVSDMTVQAQNKLLKTLEEPPKNTFLLLGATKVYSLLSTVLSRCKKLEIKPFSEDELYAYLKQEKEDGARLKSAVRLSVGKLGEALNRYETGEGYEAEELAFCALTSLNSSSQIAEFSSRINKDVLKDFISSLASLVGQALNVSCGNKTDSEKIKSVANSVSVGALIHISDKIRVAEKAVYFNGNFTAVVDGLLFGIVEGKFKWSK